MSEDLVADVTGSWDLAGLPANVRLGEGCFIESRIAFAKFSTTRDPGLVLGDRVRVYGGGWGSSFGVVGEGCVEIGDDSVLTGAQFMCANRITLGKRVVVSYNAILADADFHPREPTVRRQQVMASAPHVDWIELSPYPTEPVVVEDDARIGINAIILKGVNIGRGAHVLPGAVVTRDVPAGTTVGGNPAVAQPDGAR